MGLATAQAVLRPGSQGSCRIHPSGIRLQDGLIQDSRTIRAYFTHLQDKSVLLNRTSYETAQIS